MHTNIPYLEHLGNLKIIKTCRTVSAEISLCHIFLKTDASAFGEPHAKLQQKGCWWLFRVFVEIILASYVGVIINHYKDPY